VLKYLKLVVDQANVADVPVSVCGEMGGRPLEALALMAIGVDRLSITPAAIGPVKAMVRSAELKPLRAAMAGWLATPGVDIRAELGAMAAAQGIRLD
jgi:phosphotransferase system enzyme I (PtsP)